MDSTTIVNTLADPTMGLNIETFGLAVATFLLTFFLSKTVIGDTIFKWLDPAIVATAIGAALAILLEYFTGSLTQNGTVSAIGLVSILIHRVTKWLPRVKGNFTSTPNKE